MTDEYAHNLPTYKDLYPVPANLPEFSIEKDPNNIVGAGNDSTVYCYGAKVFKQYNSSTPLQTLLAYKDVVLHAKELFDNKPDLGSGQIKFYKTFYPYIFEINPIEAVGYGYFTKSSERISDDRFYTTVSRYIAGPLVSSFSGYTSRLGFTFANNRLQSPEKETLYSLFWMSINSKEISEQFEAVPGILSRILLQESHYQGLDIGDVNIKVRFDRERAAITFIATDLCSNLNRLRKIR